MRVGNQSSALARFAVAVFLLCLGVGCSTTPREAPPTGVDATQVAPSTLEWKPSKPLPRATMDPAERDRRNKAHLDRLATSLGIVDPPTLEPVQWIYPEEVGNFRVACLRAQGFNAESSSGGRGYKADSGSMSQKGAFDLATFKCSAQYPIDPRMQTSTWNRAQHTVVYEYLTESLIPCLRRLGANPDEVPSLEVYLTDPNNFWMYPDPGSEERMELWYSTCPIDPPSRVILGE